MITITKAALVAVQFAMPGQSIDDMGNSLERAGKQFECAARIDICASEKHSLTRTAKQENQNGNAQDL